MGYTNVAHYPDGKPGGWKLGFQLRRLLLRRKHSGTQPAPASVAIPPSSIRMTEKGKNKC